MSMNQVLESHVVSNQSSALAPVVSLPARELDGGDRTGMPPSLWVHCPRLASGPCNCRQSPLVSNRITGTSGCCQDGGVGQYSKCSRQESDNSRHLRKGALHALILKRLCASCRRRVDMESVPIIVSACWRRWTVLSPCRCLSTFWMMTPSAMPGSPGVRLLLTRSVKPVLPISISICRIGGLSLLEACIRFGERDTAAWSWHRVTHGAARTGPGGERSAWKHEDAEQWVIQRLGLPQEVWADYLESVLLTVNGWASWCAYLGWQAKLEGRSDPHLRELLAIRLAWGALLLECKEGPLGSASVWLCFSGHGLKRLLY